MNVCGKIAMTKIMYLKSASVLYLVNKIFVKPYNPPSGVPIISYVGDLYHYIIMNAIMSGKSYCINSYSYRYILPGVDPGFSKRGCMVHRESDAVCRFLKQ